MYVLQRNTRQSSTTIDEDEEKEVQSGERDLEMTYSHYLMLDDGRYRHYATGEFRTDLCTRMAKLENKNTHHGMFFDLRSVNSPVLFLSSSCRHYCSRRWCCYCRKYLF